MRATNVSTQHQRCRDTHAQFKHDTRSTNTTPHTYTQHTPHAQHTPRATHTAPTLRHPNTCSTAPQHHIQTHTLTHKHTTRTHHTHTHHTHTAHTHRAFRSSLSSGAAAGKAFGAQPERSELEPRCSSGGARPGRAADPCPARTCPVRYTGKRIGRSDGTRRKRNLLLGRTAVEPCLLQQIFMAPHNGGYSQRAVRGQTRNALHTVRFHPLDTAHASNAAEKRHCSCKRTPFDVALLQCEDALKRQREQRHAPAARDQGKPVVIARKSHVQEI